ncbi:DUF6221 family protein [Streptomyces sp. VRA16 Mangrove soil]|uniref:DUF6221 family protein n=1 Tax=Streptomyces sp. VRA16 Mangrove soil TaxID=2817434 RepID=UPI001A9F6F10|nr:DUF6221 family protein [Streptomyces sp. VRA16 Mangrove soil]MBO1330854.1 hypothetical protein [Streptomyces sp. VRA16 Mangrove soil]
MDGLVKWLGAQFDEDERIARAVSERLSDDQWDGAGDDREGERARASRPAPHGASRERASAAQDLATFVAAFDPARVLREVDAKRRVLGRHLLSPAEGDPERPWSAADACQYDGEPWPCPDLLDLALPYEDRPGYREEWRP